MGSTQRKVERVFNRRGAASAGKGVHNSEANAQKARKSAESPTGETTNAKTSRTRMRGARTKPAAKVKTPAIGVRMKIERCETRRASGVRTKATARPSLSRRVAASEAVVSETLLLVMGS